MKILPYLFTVVAGLAVSGVFGQKKISDFSIVYDYTIASSSSGKPITGTNTIYVKGNLSRSETGTQSYVSAIIHDGITGTGVILKEVSGQKILIHLTPADWQQINAKEEGLSFANTADTKTIAGYKCIKAVAKTADGSTYAVYYTSELSVDNNDYNPKFKSLPGLPLEYELTRGSVVIKYTVAKINLNPVPASKFDIPKSGYREMTFEESKKQKIGG